MTLLKFVDDEWGPVGSFNWFATHGTSMSRTNSLISGDNKGAAARFMEDWLDQGINESKLSDVSKNHKLPRFRRVSNIIPVVEDNRKYLSNFLIYLQHYIARSTCKLYGVDVFSCKSAVMWNTENYIELHSSLLT